MKWTDEFHTCMDGQHSQFIALCIGLLISLQEYNGGMEEGKNSTSERYIGSHRPGSKLAAASAASAALFLGMPAWPGTLQNTRLPCVVKVGNLT
jgi:hypothetical protein